MAPDVSVVIPTYRRPHLLERCLRAVLNQDPDGPSYEVIVVDDGHDAATRALIDATASPRVSYMASWARASGPAAARNVGWRAARARLIAFTDDDTEPTPAWLLHGVAALRRGAVDAAAGQVLVPVSERPRDHERQTAGLMTAEFVTANCFVRRDALEAVGGFDERFRLAWREDSDLQFSLLEAGRRIVRARDAVVWHPVRPAAWGDSLRQQRKVFFDALLFKKHPRFYRARIRSRPRWDYYAIVALLAAAGIAALAGWTTAAIVSFCGWTALTGKLLWNRLHGASLEPGHVAEILATSIAIPPAAVFWRFRGAMHFRVPFF